MLVAGGQVRVVVPHHVRFLRRPHAKPPAVLGVDALGCHGARDSEIARDFPELVQRMALSRFERPHQVFKAMVQMVLNQGFLGLLDRLLHCLQLLRNIEAVSPLNHHLNGAAQVPAGSAQAFDDGSMGSVCMRLCHGR